MYRYMIFGKYTKPSAKLGVKPQDFKCEGIKSTESPAPPTPVWKKICENYTAYLRIQ
jgi:hypothetical protein